MPWMTALCVQRRAEMRRRPNAGGQAVGGHGGAAGGGALPRRLHALTASSQGFCHFCHAPGWLLTGVLPGLHRRTAFPELNCRGT